jgi:hypothetical protein
MNSKDKENYMRQFGKITENIPEEIPDVEKLIEHVINLLQYINTDEMQQFEDNDPTGFETHLDNKFSDFTARYYTVFKLLLDKPNRHANVARMLELFQNLSKVKNSEKSMDTVYEEYTEVINNEFIYSKYGGKANFEREMMKQKKKQ